MSGTMQPVAWALRPATREDLDDIVGVERASFSDPWSAGSFASALGEPTEYVAVAEGPDGRAAGFVVLRVVGGAGEILDVAVSPALRGQGAGRALLSHALAEARRRGAREVFLEVRESNGVAIALYASFGFAPIGRRKRYYRDPTEDALVLRCTLDG